MNNRWLRDKEELNKIVFYDKYYLKDLLYKIDIYLKSLPIPVVTKFENSSITFVVGDKNGFHKTYKINVDIAPYDFIKIINDDLEKEFPQYRIVREEEKKITKKFVTEKILEGFTSDEIIEMSPTYKVEEFGRIFRVLLKEDKFYMEKEVNGIKTKSIWSTCTTGVLMPVSEFLRTLRCMKLENAHDMEIYDFINENSRCIKDDFQYNYDIVIDYSNIRMYNFFKINLEELRENVIDKLDELEYNIGRFTIKFKDTNIKDDCLKLL